VAESQASVNLSGFNNDTSLTVSDVKWADVLNKPIIFSCSYNDLTGRPTTEDLTGPQGPQGEVHAKDGYFEGLELIGNIDLYNDLWFKNADGDTLARPKYDDNGVEVDGHMFPDGDAEFVLDTIEKRCAPAGGAAAATPEGGALVGPSAPTSTSTRWALITP
jgi:hypothetical protein